MRKKPGVNAPDQRFPAGLPPPRVSLPAFPSPLPRALTEFDRLSSAARDLLKPLAAEALGPPLLAAGATPEGTQRAIDEIAFAVARLNAERELKIDRHAALAAITQTLMTLEGQLKALSRDDRKTMAVWLGARGLFVASNALLNAMEKFEASLPLLIQRLPPVWRKSGAQDQALNFTIYAACGAWREETGKWPSATVTPEVGVTAPLFQFLARHCEVTPATWSRALAAAKKRRPPWLRGPQDTPRQKARTSQSKAPDCD